MADGAAGRCAAGGGTKAAAGSGASEADRPWASRCTIRVVGSNRGHGTVPSVANRSQMPCTRSARSCGGLVPSQPPGPLTVSNVSKTKGSSRPWAAPSRPPLAGESHSNS